MTSPDPNRLGIHQLLPYVEVGDERIGGVGFALEVELDGFLQIGHRFLAGRAETGHIHVEALTDKEFFLAVNDVGHLFHVPNLAEGSTRGNHD